MAFKDITKVLYEGSIKLNYIDKTHYYSVQSRVDYDLAEDDPKAWGKKSRPTGTTTLLGDTLEKKGLMTWPMGVALQELFGFYDFTGEDAEGKPVKRTGFSKDKGTMWLHINGKDGGDNTASLTKDQTLNLVLSASKGWTRRQKKGADIGSVVHDAIEHYIKELPFDIPEQYMWSIKDADYTAEVDRISALEDFESDTEKAGLAFTQFCIWWESQTPVLLGAEDLVYSKQYNISGTFDGLIELNGRVILCDWKTSNASKSKEAAMPEGINYQYFIQSAIYAMAWMEMGGQKVDDLMIVSCRKDGGFTTIMASELGYTVDDCIEWAQAVIVAHRFAKQTKAGLIAHAEKEAKK